MEAFGVTKRVEQKLVLAEWVRFLSSTTRITELNLVSRVPQDLLNAVGEQSQLKALAVKWGPYSILEPLRRLTELRDLSLGGARAVSDLQPLVVLHRLRKLAIDQPFSASNPEVLGQLQSLETLRFGNADPASDHPLDVVGLEWVGRLRNLRILHLPGTRLPAEQLPMLASLPNLVQLRIPLHNVYRKVVFELAPNSRAFAYLAREYEQYDERLQRER